MATVVEVKEGTADQGPRAGPHQEGRVAAGEAGVVAEEASVMEMAVAARVGKEDQGRLKAPERVETAVEEAGAGAEEVVLEKGMAAAETAEQAGQGWWVPSLLAVGEKVGAAGVVAAEGSVMAMAAAGRGGKEGQVSTAKPGQAEMAVEAAEGEEVAVA